MPTTWVLVRGPANLPPKQDVYVNDVFDAPAGRTGEPFEVEIGRNKFSLRSGNTIPASAELNCPDAPFEQPLEVVLVAAVAAPAPTVAAPPPAPAVPPAAPRPEAKPAPKTAAKKKRAKKKAAQKKATKKKAAKKSGRKAAKKKSASKKTARRKGASKKKTARKKTGRKAARRRAK